MHAQSAKLCHFKNLFLVTLFLFFRLVFFVFVFVF